MTGINLIGSNHYSSAKMCQRLYQGSRVLHDSRSISRVWILLLQFYRVGAHVFLLGGIWLISLYIKHAVFLTDLVILGMSYFVVTYFIDLHADAAEALTLTYLLE